MCARKSTAPRDVFSVTGACSSRFAICPRRKLRLSWSRAERRNYGKLQDIKRVWRLFEACPGVRICEGAAQGKHYTPFLALSSLKTASDFSVYASRVADVSRNLFGYGVIQRASYIFAFHHFAVRGESVGMRAYIHHAAVFFDRKTPVSFCCKTAGA